MGRTHHAVAAVAAVCVAVVKAPAAQAFPVVGGQGLVPNARAVVDYIQATYPGVLSIGGVRQDALPDHPSGRAVDIMVGGNAALGNQIAADLRAQSGRFGMRYLLWQTVSHYDHVHVSVN